MSIPTPGSSHCRSLSFTVMRGVRAAEVVADNARRDLANRHQHGLKRERTN